MLAHYFDGYSRAADRVLRRQYILASAGRSTSNREHLRGELT
jgi:hypothetical protein